MTIEQNSSKIILWNRKYEQKLFLKQDKVELYQEEKSFTKMATSARKGPMPMPWVSGNGMFLSAILNITTRMALSKVKNITMNQVIAMENRLTSTSEGDRSPKVFITKEKKLRKIFLTREAYLEKKKTETDIEST